MTFWGVEIHPEKPYNYADEDGMTKLHLSQATLGLECKGKQRTVVKCKVGENPEVLLCSLVPGVSESCALDLLFDQDVTFSVSGATSVHLTGYYMPIEEPYSSEEEDYDSEEEGFEFSGDEDDEDVSDLEAQPSSVKIEEVKEVEVKAATNGNKRKKGDSAVKAAKAEDIVMGEEDSEDEDGLPKKAATEETPAKKQAVAGANGAPTPSAATPNPDTPASDGKKKKKKKNKKNKHATETPEGKTNGETKTTESPAPAKTAASPAAAKEVALKKEINKKYPNGLEVQTLAIGKPDAKQAAAGKKVAMQYIGKLKSNGKVFDSTVGKRAFEFRLGVGEVIKGWDVGVDGMRVGDKRRLIIPPHMAYGAKGVPGTIPGNSWLTFDVELVNVK
jgi:FK506-binding nuclear protein